jgi:hypothetical protein
MYAAVAGAVCPYLIDLVLLCMCCSPWSIFVNSRSVCTYFGCV